MSTYICCTILSFLHSPIPFVALTKMIWIQELNKSLGKCIKKLHMKEKKVIQSKLNDENREQCLSDLYRRSFVLVGGRGKRKKDTPVKRKLRHNVAERGKIEKYHISCINQKAGWQN